MNREEDEDTLFERQTETGFEESVQAEAERKERSMHLVGQKIHQRWENFREDDDDILKGTEQVMTDLAFTRPLQCFQADFQRLIISNPTESIDGDTVMACKALKKCMMLREKWQKYYLPLDSTQLPAYVEILSPPAPSMSSNRGGGDYWRRPEPKYEILERPVTPSVEYFSHEMIDGITKVFLKYEDNQCKQVFSGLSFEEFVGDFITLRNNVHSGPVKTYSFKKLELLSAKFNLHCLLNEQRENDAAKSVPHRDFYNVRKVDTHVHHSACMNQKHLLRFIKNKLKQNPNEVVVYRDGKFLTLEEVFKTLRLTVYDLSIDTLDMHATNTFHRFDRFNLKYNPAGQSRLRDIFLKTDNVIGGKYLAEITQEVIAELDANKYQLVEWRISIYGRTAGEWSNLARWFYVNRLAHKNVRWLIQVPRLYESYRKAGQLQSFAEMLHNIFTPLFQVTLDPSSNIPLFYLLEAVVGFDSVDDESKPEYRHLNGGAEACPTPDKWILPENPPYGYWLYYMYSNICTLNQLRACRGLSTFQFRPHCGEAGDVDHLVSAYLLAHQVNHGILLRKAPTLQYLFYLSQIGIAMSPLSNNKLFLDYNKNPFPKYFKQGLNVSLSTDDPLMLHYTKDPLLEEYSVATQVWKFTSTDQCEIARNSVLQSGWELAFKKHFLGEDLSDIRETNVPLIRLQYRQETLREEIQEIETYSEL